MKEKSQETALHQKLPRASSTNESDAFLLAHFLLGIAIHVAALVHVELRALLMEKQHCRASLPRFSGESKSVFAS